MYMTVCQNPCALALLKFPLPGNLPGIFRKPSGSTVFCCCVVGTFAGTLARHLFSQCRSASTLTWGWLPGVALPGIFRKSSGNLPEFPATLLAAVAPYVVLLFREIFREPSGNLPEPCVFLSSQSLPENLPGTFRKPSGTMRFLTPPVAHESAHF